MTRYVCPHCSQGGAHPASLPAPRCHRCSSKPIMVPEAQASPAFSLDDDTPLVCTRDQSGDTTCESCQ